MTFDPLPSVISLRASESGALLYEMQDGLTIEWCGPALAPASLSARQAKAAGLMTSGTYGRPSTGSSNSAPLGLFLASRLQARTDWLGSTLYKLTWKERATPSGRSIPALRASALRISGSGSTGWPTPCVVEPDTHPEKVWERKRRLTEATGVYRGNDSGLGSKVQLSAWPTPCQQDGPKGGPSQGIDRLPGATSLAGWATPDASLMNDGEGLETWGARQIKNKAKHGNGNGAGMPIAVQAQMVGWTTPQAHDTSGRSPTQKDLHGTKHGCACLTLDAQKALGPARLTASGEMLTGSAARMESGGQLHPEHSLWLQLGPFSTAWARCAARVTRSTSRKRKASSKR